MTKGDTQLSRGALYVAFGQAAFVLIGYLLHMFLGRWLTPALFGVFGVTMTVLVWIEITVNNGVPLALQKFLPDSSLSEESVLHASARSQALFSVGVFALAYLAAPLLAELLNDPTLTGFLRLAFLDILAMGAYAYFRGALNGWRSFRQLSLTITAYSVTKLVAIFVLVYLGFGVRGALAGNIVASLGGLAVGFFWTWRRKARATRVGPAECPPEPFQPQARVAGRTILAFVLPAALFTLASNLLLGLDLMGVKALLPDPAQAGYYSAAVKLAEAPRLVLLAFSFTLLPSLSHAIAAHDQARTRRYLQQTMRLLALVLFPILALVTATAESLVILTFSAPYRPAAPILTVLIFTYAAYTLYITLVTSFLAENRPGRALAIPVSLLPVAIALLWLGIARFGTLGAAFASLLTVTVAAIVVTAYVLRRFRPSVSGLIPSLLRIGMASVVIWALAWLWSPSGLLLLLAYGLLGVLYLAMLLVLRELRIKDLKMVMDWLPARRSDRGG